ncbi:MAG: hypothetical protein HC925_04060 [Coleofasciculaceae cyanobacterium SM2_3_26]|nr:hypothetical protein [Coleofasciculaceae cyanobacterium SM2_3_26]
MVLAIAPDRISKERWRCDRRGVESSRELLPGADAPPGLYLLPADT